MVSINIIIPHLMERDIKPTIESIFNQTYRDYRIIIVTDYERKGASWARNKAAFNIDRNWDFIFYCDDDVILEPDCLQIMVKALEGNKEYGFVYCNSNVHTSHEYDYESLKEANYIDNMALIRTEDNEDYNEDLKRFNDWEKWLRMGSHGIQGLWIDRQLYSKATNNNGISERPDFQYWFDQVKEFYK